MSPTVQYDGKVFDSHHCFFFLKQKILWSYWLKLCTVEDRRKHNSVDQWEKICSTWSCNLDEVNIRIYMSSLLKFLIIDYELFLCEYGLVNFTASRPNTVRTILVEPLIIIIASSEETAALWEFSSVCGLPLCWCWRFFIILRQKLFVWRAFLRGKKDACHLARVFFFIAEFSLFFLTIFSVLQNSSVGRIYDNVKICICFYHVFQLSALHPCRHFLMSLDYLALVLLFLRCCIDVFDEYRREFWWVWPDLSNFQCSKWLLQI